jgi:hypothetical protein
MDSWLKNKSCQLKQVPPAYLVDYRSSAEYVLLKSFAYSSPSSHSLSVVIQAIKYVIAFLDYLGKMI